MLFCFVLIYFKIRDNSGYENNPGKTPEVEKKRELEEGSLGEG